MSLVIHADLPHDAEVLQHRSGRTGRAGRKGTSVLLIPASKRRRAEQMLAIAKVNAEWAAPPTADEIRRLDGERMWQDPLFTETPSEEDLAMGEALLAQRTPQELAAALAKIYRARLPEPEDVTDPGAGPERKERKVYDPADSARIDAEGPSVWFRLNLGRRDNADPRRLLPMLTRRGNIGRQEIGAIRIFDRETKFEIRGGAPPRASPPPSPRTARRKSRSRRFSAASPSVRPRARRVSRAPAPPATSGKPARSRRSAVRAEGFFSPSSHVRPTIVAPFAGTTGPLSWKEKDRVRCVTSLKMDHTSPQPSPSGQGDRICPICLSETRWHHPVIPGPRSGARDPETQVVQDFTLSAALDSGLACGDPE